MKSRLAVVLTVLSLFLAGNVPAVNAVPHYHQHGQPGSLGGCDYLQLHKGLEGPNNVTTALTTGYTFTCSYVAVRLRFKHQGNVMWSNWIDNPLYAVVAGPQNSAVLNSRHIVENALEGITTGVVQMY